MKKTREYKTLETFFWMHREAGASTDYDGIIFSEDDYLIIPRGNGLQLVQEDVDEDNDPVDYWTLEETGIMFSEGDLQNMVHWEWIELKEE